MKKRSRNRDGTASGSTLGDQLRAVGKQLRKTRGRRAQTTAAEKPVAKADPSQTDNEVFLAATEGVKALQANRSRVDIKPAQGYPRSVDSEPKTTDFAAEEHFDLRFSDLFIHGRAAGVSRETVDRLARGEFAVRSHVDLHGMAFDDAKNAVDRFLVERQKRGDRCVLVITGKGKNSPGQIAVLRERIPQWLVRGPSSRRVLAFVTARPCDGGEGALYVLLRKSTARKIRIEIEAGSGK